MYRYHCQNPPVQTFHYHKLPVAFPDINENTIPQYFADMRLRYCFPPFCSSPVPISVDSSSHPSLFTDQKGEPFHLSVSKFPYSGLSYKIRSYMALFFRQFQSHFQSQVLAVNEKCHIVPKGSHGLQSLQILPHVFRAGPVYHVPIL